MTTPALPPPAPDEKSATPAPTGAAKPEAVATGAAPAAGVQAPGKARPKWKMIAGGVVLLAALAVGVPWGIQVMGTESTDDAYINGHVTFVAPRVAGQVAKVFVDDNNRVHKGDLLVELDKEPYEVQASIAQAAVAEAQAELVLAQAEARATEGQIRSLRFSLDHAIEDVDNQVAQLRSKAASVVLQKAALAKAQADFDRVKPLMDKGFVSKEEYDRRQEEFLVSQAQLEEALQSVYQIRVSLGLPPQPTTGDDLAQVPDDLDQTFSSVKQAQAKLMEAAAQLGVTDSFNKTPKEMIATFYERDPQGNIDNIFAQLLVDAPAVKQAQAKLMQTQRNLDQANLNLRYCDIVAEIDGVVTRRNVNPGNNVIPGQSLMAVRSLTEIWVDANFKETQLARLRIGQAVNLYVDAYGSRRQFKGRISGFTMGTGSTLALLPAENATGNFVKVVQRLPVRIDLVDYHPEEAPLFIGLSVTPVVQVNQPPSGPNAGQVLQPYLPTAAPPAVAASDAAKLP